MSAGSTGALHVGASLIVRTLKGVKRPALATTMPAAKQTFLLLDCGANVRVPPEMLNAFARHGQLLRRTRSRAAKRRASRWSTTAPRRARAPPRCREAHQLLKTTPGIRFAGNIEPRDVPNGEVDVVVCDGFTGNVILKLTEGVAKRCWGC